MVRLLLVLATGCEGVARMPPSIPDASAVRQGPPDLTVHLETVEPLVLPERSWTLPSSLGTSLLATTARGELLLGGATGLHAMLSDGGTEPLFSSAVHGLVTLPSGDAMFLTDGGFFVRTGTLIRPSELTGALPSANSMQRAGDELWFTTDDDVLRLNGTQLSRFTRPGVRSMRGPVDGRWILRTSESVFAARVGASGELELETLSDERALVDAAPTTTGFLGLDDAGALFHRAASEDGGSRWHPLVLSTDPDAGPTTGARIVGVDSESGATWLALDGALARLTGRRLATRTMEPFTSLVVEDTGSVLLRTSTGLRRLGSDAPVRFADQLEPLSQTKCESCHRQSGSAQPVLETATQWANAIDRILQRVDPQTPELTRMPRGQEPLTADELTRLRRWKEEGFRP